MGVKICVLAVLVMLAILGMHKAQAQRAPSGGVSKKGCPDRCGEVVIPYPFGTTTLCALSDNFLVRCNGSSNARPSLSVDGAVGLEVLNITLESGTLRLRWGYISYVCSSIPVVTFPGINLNTTQYMLSYAENMFFASGCNNTARIDDLKGRFFGCTTTCGNGTPNDPTCSGRNNCCQISIPTWLTGFNQTNVVDENNYDNKSLCSSIVLAQKGYFNARTVDLDSASESERQFPIVWDWVVEKITCDEAMSSPNYACVGGNSECVNSTNGPGYICKCSKGYEGNPYLDGENGCQDIDECSQNDDDGPCPKGQTCRNTDGRYTCTDKDGLPTYAKFLIGFGVGLPVLLLIASWISWFIQKRRFLKRKEEFFRQNGGLLLQQHISTNQDNAFKIFTAAELEKATDKYSKQRILGQGGFGIVYKGIFDDGRVVAIKKSMMVDESKSREFAREMQILSQINHVNVVKLLGCCLDVEAPMLVYEFIPHGTLYHYIHYKRHERPIGWSIRLKLAVESAKALGYLHAEASPTILHGDIKSSNILLDEHYTAKVSDFGTSTLAPKDRSRFMTVVQGTWGYLDPEYLQTCQLTEKSDVYSFGVVVAELLTGKKAIYKGEDGEEKSLAFEFSLFVKKNKLLEILDDQLVDDKASLKQIQAAANIAVQCLSMNGEERPTMTHISLELEMLGRSGVHPWVDQNIEEMESLLDDKTNYSNPSTSEHTNPKTQDIHDVESGR